MFGTDPKIQEYSETAIIEKIRGWLGPLNPNSPEGIGDDCAITTAKSEQQLVTTDSVTYGQHVDASVSAADVGRKLINRNLSDIAAMGGVPDRAVLSLLCGPDLSLVWLESFFDGIVSAARESELKIVGGDLSRLDKGQFSSVLTLLGTTAAPILRKTGQIGDHIYVTGTLGGSLLGKHYEFRPRLKEGQWLAQFGKCSSMMDITDGLAKDLPDLLPDATCARLKLESIPVSDAARTTSRKKQTDPLFHAFCDGEDYELVFTIRSEVRPEDFEQEWCSAFPNLEINRIGIIDERLNEARLIDASGNALPWKNGFEHFSASNE